MNGAAFDRGGNRIAVARTGGAIELWDVASQEVVQQLPGDSLGDNEVRFSTEKDPRWVVSAGLSGTTHVVNVQTRRAKATLELDANAQSASLSPDGAQVVVAYVDGPARIWDVSTEKSVLSLPAGWGLTAVYSSDGKRVLTADDDAALSLGRPDRKAAGEAHRLKVVARNHLAASAATESAWSRGASTATS